MRLTYLKKSITFAFIMVKKIHFGLIFILFPLFGFAQLNLIVGYDAAFKEQKEINYAITRYNRETVNLTNKLAQMWHSSGLDLGLRYNFEFFALEGHYLTKFRNTSGTTTVNDVKSKQKVKLNDQAFSLAIVSNIKKVGIGLAWENHRFQFSKKFQGNQDFVKAFPEALRYNTLQFFLDLKIPSNEKMGAVFRPYFNLGIQGDNISQAKIENVMNLSQQANQFNKTHWNSFGLKLLFFNGRQPERE